MERKFDKKILLIDDSALMRRAMSDIIKQIDGYTVVHLASDGLEGIQYLRAHTSDIDVIMTDIDMPGMDGLTLIKVQRRNISQFLLLYSVQEKMLMLFLLHWNLALLSLSRSQRVYSRRMPVIMRIRLRKRF